MSMLSLAPYHDRDDPGWECYVWLSTLKGMTQDGNAMFGFYLERDDPRMGMLSLAIYLERDDPGWECYVWLLP